MLNGRPLKILVVGCGSIGRRHIRLLKEMGVEVVGLEANIQTADKTMTELGIPVEWDLKWALEDKFHRGAFDGAIIATPNHLHREPAEEALRAGCGVLIEKPMCHTLDEAGALGLLHRVYPQHPLLVGYNMRYHPGLRRLKELIDTDAIGKVRHASFHFGHDLRQWRPGTDYLAGYAAKRETGGGVLLDCSHEIDLSNWFFGEPRRVMAMVRNTGALEGLETEDLADVLIDYEAGLQVHIHADYLSQQYRRGCTIIGDKATLQFVFEPDGYYLQVGNRLHQEYWTVDRDVMYRAELTHFLICIRGEETPLVTGEDGIRVLRLVEAAKRSSAEGRVVML